MAPPRDDRAVRVRAASTGDRRVTTSTAPYRPAPAVGVGDLQECPLMDPRPPSSDGWDRRDGPDASRSGSASPYVRSDPMLPLYRLHGRDHRRRPGRARLGVGHLPDLADDLADPGRRTRGDPARGALLDAARPARRDPRRAAPRLRRPDLPPAVHHRRDRARRSGGGRLGRDGRDARGARAARGARGTAPSPTTRRWRCPRSSAASSSRSSGRPARRHHRPAAGGPARGHRRSRRSSCPACRRGWRPGRSSCATD